MSTSALGLCHNTFLNVSVKGDFLCCCCLLNSGKPFETALYLFKMLIQKISQSLLVMRFILSFHWLHKLKHFFQKVILQKKLWLTLKYLLKKFSHASKLSSNSVADPGFPVGGSVDPWCRHLLAKMYAKTNELGPTLACRPRSANATCKFHYPWIHTIICYDLNIIEKEIKSEKNLKQVNQTQTALWIRVKSKLCLSFFHSSVSQTLNCCTLDHILGHLFHTPNIDNVSRHCNTSYKISDHTFDSTLDYLLPFCTLYHILDHLAGHFIIA